MTAPTPFTGPHINPGDYVDIVNEAGMTVGRCQFWPMPIKPYDPIDETLGQLEEINYFASQIATEDAVREHAIIAASVIDRIVMQDALAAETTLRAELVDRITSAWADMPEFEDMAVVAVDHLRRVHPRGTDNWVRDHEETWPKHQVAVSTEVVARA